ncbi:unnamed protein product [Sympodiomycopsis kandeliae]
MSRSFFSPDNQTGPGGDHSHTNGHGLHSGIANGESSKTTEYGRSSPPPTSDRDEARVPFLGTGQQNEGARRRGSISDNAGESLTALKALPPILSYCVASITMTVVNKFVLSGSHFSMNLVVLLIQNLVGVICVIAAQRAGLIELRELNYRDAKAWAPISTLLVLTIWTGSKALQYLNIPVYTIFKNLTIILIAYGEVIWFGGRVTMLAFFSFSLMVLSSVIAAWSDISRALAISQLSVPHTPDSIMDGASFDPNTQQPKAAFDVLGDEKQRLNALQASAGGIGDVGGDADVLDGMRGWGLLNSGYMWMALNCVVSAAYLLVMRKRIKAIGFKDWDTMFYNNLLSLPILLAMSLLVENWSTESWVTNFPPETRTRLVSAIIFSGACAVFIGYTTAWCVRTTSSTTYSMVGALNKLPLAVSGMIFFKDPPVTLGSTSAIGVGFGAGVVYTIAKQQQAAASKKAMNEVNTGLRGSQMEDGKPGAGEIPMHRMEERDRRRD